ncbi:MAG TPA: TRAP transporter fused permease subunit [Rhizobiaceae bacterium]|nr:TRAP transporter fused permease subunit [Rhizobiaceae bacterium]
MTFSTDNTVKPPGRLRGAARLAVLITSAIGLVVAIAQVFHVPVFGFVIIANSYYYILLATFLSIAFLAFPARKADEHQVRWYDWALFAVSLAANLYLAVHGLDIIQRGWDMVAPPVPTFVAGVLCLLALEGLRRATGTLLFVIATFFAFYPLFAEHMPGFLWGVALPLPETIRAHAMGVESIVGIPFRTVAELLIGYLIFGVALVVTGGGDFFMDFANALMGRSRGGPAKVAVISSGLQGMLSGSVVSNVVTSGVMTIPTMQRCGYRPAYAAAVEACASTGGAIMPPVMGAAAFIMASFLNVPYAEIVVAAAFPAFLYYLALTLQADLYAARTDLKGLPEEEIPNLWATLKDGWVFLFSIVALTYMLIVVRIETYAPLIATAFLIVAAIVRRKDRFTPRKALELILESGVNIAHLVAVLAGIGFLVGSLSITGVAGAFARELIEYAGGNQALLLLFGAITSFVLGMGMTVSSCYIFLAIVLAPALVESGVPAMVAHLFILYYGTLSYITPPVALAAITAAAINKSNPIQVGFHSLRLGIVLLIVPFVFVINPSLIMQGTWYEITETVVTTSAGVWLIASGFEAYLYGVGRVGRMEAVLLIAAGGLLFFPGLETGIPGALIAVAIYAYRLVPRMIRSAEHSEAGSNRLGGS